MNTRSAVLEKLKPIVKTLGDPVCWALSQREIAGLIRRYPGSRGSDIVPITTQYRGHGWYKRLGAYQVDDEFSRLADWASEVRPRVVVEIGTASGATLLLWSRLVEKRVVSIDLPGGIHGGGYAEQKSRLFREFVSDRPHVAMDLVRASSQAPETKAHVRKLLVGDAVDLLFIDGDHRLDGVTRDFELWRDLVRPGGHILFHDILPHTRLPSCQVDQLWQRLQREHPGHTMEIVAARDQGWAGIGILQV